MFRAWSVAAGLVMLLGAVVSRGAEPIPVTCSGELGEFTVTLVPVGPEYSVVVRSPSSLVVSVLVANELLEYRFLSRSQKLNPKTPAIVSVLSHAMLNRYPIFSLFSPAESEWSSDDVQVKSAVCRLPKP